MIEQHITDLDRIKNLQEQIELYKEKEKVYRSYITDLEFIIQQYKNVEALRRSFQYSILPLPPWPLSPFL